MSDLISISVFIVVLFPFSDFMKLFSVHMFNLLSPAGVRAAV